jgi:hypothetical protein
VGVALLHIYAAVQVQEEFMSYEEFKAKFIEPIRKGQERDATPSDKGQMTRKLGILQTETAVGSGGRLLCRLCGP